MKKLLSIVLLATMLLLSSCGLTVTKIENTNENEFFTKFEEHTTAPEKTEIIEETTSYTIEETTSYTIEETTAESKTALTTKSVTATSSNDKTTIKPTIVSTKEVEKSTITKAATTNKNIAKPTKKFATEKSKNTVPATIAVENPIVISSTTVPANVEVTTKAPASCTIEISCKTILSNIDELETSKRGYVPANGEILAKTTVLIDEGDTAFDVLKRVCVQNGIQLEYRFTPAYNSYYVEGIHQIYEFDCGDNSGWMYSVNNSFPNKGCNMYNVKNGDVIKFLYTCDLGSDLGADIQ